MPQSLTQEHFDETMRSIAQTLNEHGTRFDKIDATLADHTKRLERIENILWDGQRMEEIERRLIKIAETVGLPELTIPIRRPIGS